MSNTSIDGAALAAALGSNATLTSLDVRRVPKMGECFEALGSMLLQPSATSRLAYMRCDAFDLLEGEHNISLRERPLYHGAVRLLTGLLRHNRDVHEIDLAATGLQPGARRTRATRGESDPCP